MTNPIDLKSEVDVLLINLKYAKEIDKEYGITKLQLAALRLLSTDDKYQMNDKEKELVEEFIENSTGNQVLNKKIKEISIRETIEKDGLSKDVLNEMATFTFKTRRYLEFDKVYQKILTIKEDLDPIKNIEIKEKEKLSLKEYSILLDMTKLSALFDRLKKKIKFSDESNLGKLYSKIKESKEVNDEMEHFFSEKFSVNPGTVSFDDMTKKSYVLGKVLSLLDKIIRTFITKHWHASKIYLKSDQKVAVSHIDPEPKDNDFKMRDFLYSDIYVIKLDKLISEESQKKLQAIYGDDWLKIINEEYQKIESIIHERTVEKFKKLEAKDGIEVQKVGFFSILPFSIGHKKIRSNDFKDIHRKIMGDYYTENKSRMLCSEFVSHTMIASMVELNSRIQEKSREKKIKISSEVIVPPISKYENLGALHSDRLLKILKKKGCLEKVESPGKLKKYFKSS